MTTQTGTPAGLLDPRHAAVLAAAQRAPSAHNAQPWRLVVDGDAYVLHYDHLDYLPADPDDRDAYLCLGAYVETLALAAMTAGLRLRITPVFGRDGADLTVAELRLVDAEPGEPIDPLAALVGGRHTNRSRYDRTPVPEELMAELATLGCRFLPPRRIARLVARASAYAWRDPRFVADLDTWVSGDETSLAGMTPGPLLLARYEWWALRLAFRLRSLPSPLAALFSSRDVRQLRTAQTVAVLAAPSLDPSELFEAGRRLLRSWVAICGAGFAYHPISIAIDRPETCPDVARLAGVVVPVAVFRIGRPSRTVPASNRRALADVVTQAR